MYNVVSWVVAINGTLVKHICLIFRLKNGVCVCVCVMSKMHHHEFVSCYNFIVKLYIWKTWHVMFTSKVIARGWDRIIAECLSLGYGCTWRFLLLLLFLFSRSLEQLNKPTHTHTHRQKQVNWRYLKQMKPFFYIIKCNISICLCSTFDLLLVWIGRPCNNDQHIFRLLVFLISSK